MALPAGGFIQMLNMILNRNHNWFDYDEDLAEKQWRWYGANAGTGEDHNGLPYGVSEEEGGSPYSKNGDTLFGNLGTGLDAIFENLPELMNSLTAYYAHNTLTGAEQEQNAYNSAEAQKSRDFTEFMARNKYSMETQSMQDAGVNPAVVYGGGNLVQTSANGAQAQGHLAGGGDFFGMLNAMVRLPMELKALEAQVRNTDANTDKTTVETEGMKLQNYITDSTKDAIIEFTNMSPEERRASIDNILQNTKSEKVRTDILGVELIQSKLDYDQNKRMYELIFEMQRMQNEYQKFVNDHQEAQWNAEYDKICNEVYELYTRACENMSAVELNNATTALRGAEEELTEQKTETEKEATKTQEALTYKTQQEGNRAKYDPQAHITGAIVRPMQALHNFVGSVRPQRFVEGKNNAWHRSVERSSKRAREYAKRKASERLQEMYSTVGQAETEFGEMK